MTERAFTDSSDQFAGRLLGPLLLAHSAETFQRPLRSGPASAGLSCGGRRCYRGRRGSHRGVDAQRYKLRRRVVCGIEEPTVRLTPVPADGFGRLTFLLKPLQPPPERLIPQRPALCGIVIGHERFRLGEAAEHPRILSWRSLNVLEHKTSGVRDRRLCSRYAHSLPLDQYPGYRLDEWQFVLSIGSPRACRQCVHDLLPREADAQQIIDTRL